VKCCLDRKLIGEVLIERGVITPAQLQAALEAKKNEPSVYVGDILIRMGFAAEIDIVTALVLQCNLPYIAVSQHCIVPEVLCLIPGDIVRRERVVPLDRIGNIFSVVMANPLNETLREEMERLTGCRIAVFISTASEIGKAIDRFYPKGA